MAEKFQPFRFGIVVAEARRRAGLTLHVLAERAGLSPTALWELERRGGGRAETALRVLAALDVRLAGLPAQGGPSVLGRLRAARERRGWSVPEAARRAGVSPAALRRVEAGAGRVGTMEALLDVLAPRTRVRADERARWQGGGRDIRLTPAPIIEAIVRAVGRPIDVDPAHHPASHIGAATTHGIEENGLVQSWKGVVYANPPYSGAAEFIRRAHAAWRCGEADVVVMLLAVQSHQRVWHERVFGAADVFLLLGRPRFLDSNGQARDRAPFPMAIVVYGADEDMLNRMLGEFGCILIRRSVERGTRNPHDDLRRSIG